MNERVPDLSDRIDVPSRRLSPPSSGVVQSATVPEDGELCVGAPSFRDARLGRFLDGWLRFRGDRPMPRRRDIDPSAFPELLPKIYLYEAYDRDDTGRQFRCVLAGEDIHQAWNGAIMGRDIVEMFDAQDLPRITLRWSFILDHPAALHGFQREPGSTTSAERILLPVADDAGISRFVFGITIYQRDMMNDASGISPLPEVLYYDLSRLSDER